jgi:AraC family transcriptional regulator
MNLEAVDKSTEFDALLRGPSLRSVSSRELDWKGLVIESHRGEPGERPESVAEQYILGLWCKHTALGEHISGRGRYVPFAKRPGTITLSPPGGILPRVRSSNPFEIVLCALDLSFVNGVRDELERPADEVRYQTGFYDATLRQLISLLAAEARQGGPMGRLYADHLAHALAMRLFFLEAAEKQKASAGVSALPRHLLRRVQERMHDLCTDLDLETLAAESGYSRCHFLRMFQVATGYTPHRYLLQLRLERAQALMRRRATSLIDIAADCGFSSHAHMTNVFRKLLGVTPSLYRRNL